MPADNTLPQAPTERHGNASQPYPCHAAPDPPTAEWSIDYGYCRRSDGAWEPSVCITSSADTDEGAHTPAQSVTINSRAGLLALREVIDEALRQPDAEPKGDTP